VKKFFIIALLILKPLFHAYEFTESMQALIENSKTKRTNTVKPKHKKEATMKHINVNTKNQAKNKKPITKHAGSYSI